MNKNDARVRIEDDDIVLYTTVLYVFEYNNA